MSKVLVDRELLERAMYAKDGKELIAANRELRAILAQPAEAEGVDFGFDDRSVKVSQEAYSIFMERERHHLAALSAVTAEVKELRALLSKSLPIVEAHAGASHMLEGFRPKRNKWDELVDGIRSALTAKRCR